MSERIDDLVDRQRWAPVHLNAISAEIGRCAVIDEQDRHILAVTMALDYPSAGVLLGGPPGVGKTIVAKALAGAIGGEFSRIQGTPDKLPADITGTEMPDEERRHWGFVPGPLFANVVLADEITRLAPRTQSALLEGMQEGQATIGRYTYPTPKPHRVLATYNPAERSQGTYLLTLANLDRFITSLDMHYLDEHNRFAIMERSQNEPNNVVGLDEFMWSSKAIRYIQVDPDKMWRVVRIQSILDKFEIVDSQQSNVLSNRVAGHIIYVAQGLATAESSPSVADEHVDRAAIKVLGHRIAFTDEALEWGETGAHAVEEALKYSYSS